MTPLCWLARMRKLMAAVMCVHVCGRLRASAVVLVRAPQLFCVAHRWVGYAEWAQRGLAAIQAISPTSIITHNYTLNRLKNRVTTNQPGSHGGREK